MPKARLPTTTKGWAVTIVASLVGFVSGFATIRIMERLWK